MGPNTKMDLEEIGWEGIVWINWAQESTGSFEYKNKHSDPIQCVEFLH
jgi:hypothetical protein